MKFFLLFTHPCGDVCVRDSRGQERWLRVGSYIVNKDGTISRKPIDKSTKNV